jgi:uncharacterized membrane protein (DUF373 family)
MAVQMKQFFNRWRSAAGRTTYQRFESLVALVLRLSISVIIILALGRLVATIVLGLVFHAQNPLDPKVFQNLFGDILTVLIALEFNHTLHYVVPSEQSVIQTKIVLLIALLALARKFIILDLRETTPNELFGLGAITLALGITYWLLRERDDRLPPDRAQSQPDQKFPDSEA